MLFKQLNQVTQIDLSFNQIEDLDSDVFIDKQSLKILDLSCNKLKNLNLKLFKYCPNLETVYLQNNNITDLHSFEYIKVLIENNLYISNNILKRCAKKFKLVDIKDLEKRYSKNIKIYHRKNSLIYDVTSKQDKRFFILFFKKNILNYL